MWFGLYCKNLSVIYFDVLWYDFRCRWISVVCGSDLTFELTIMFQRMNENDKLAKDDKKHTIPALINADTKCEEI